MDLGYVWNENKELSKFQRSFILETWRWLLLLGNPHGLTTSARRLCPLSTHAKSPVVTKTAVASNFLQPLQIFSQLVVQVIGHHVGDFSVFIVFVTVEKPVGNLELARIIDDRYQLFQLFFGEFTSSLVQIDISFLARDVGKSSADTSDDRQGERHFPFAVNIRVENTNNVLEFRGDDKGHLHK